MSSTFTDLREERQAAVEAILKAGHIPAGMELFTAGNEAQLQVIRRWIDESDVYLLILGGRYGSIEPKSGLSYTKAEFDYARALGKPFFAIVITDEGLETRVKNEGTSILEKEHPDKFKAFKVKVTSQLCAFFDTPKDIKLAVFESLPQFAQSISIGGWVAASDVTPSEDVARQLTALLEENSQLKRELEKAQSHATTPGTATATFHQLAHVLGAKKITIPRTVYDPGPDKPQTEITVLRAVLTFSSDLARGVSNAMGTDKAESFLFYNVASQLASLGLAEEAKVPSGVHWQRLKLSKDGVRFVTWAGVALDGAATTPPSTDPAATPEAEPPSRAPKPTRKRKRSS